uniref:Methyltransferase-like protein 17, mitochondrial n=1 Tax=Steinernema glaseri TaxID=37863 RepID=A0A1I7YQ84_9BILA
MKSMLHRRCYSAIRQAVEESSLSKSYDGKQCHVKSENTETKVKSILQLEVSNGKRVKVRKEAVLPPKAVEGLRNALTQCNRPPKQLQHEADLMWDKLSQRRFPASPTEVRAARNQIKNKLSRNDDIGDSEEVFNEKVKRGREQHLRREVEKLLKKTSYNWKPLDFDSKEDSATYALARFSGNYAEILRVLQEFKRTDFAPETVLDYSCGVGSAFWAVNELYGERVKEYTLVDPNDNITRFAMDILRGDGNNDGNALVHPNMNFRRNLVPSLQTKYDLVIAHRALIEVPSIEARHALLGALWLRAKKYLVLIEGDLEDSFKALIEARDFILTASNELHFDETAQLLYDNGLLDDEMQKLMSNKRISHYERYAMIKEKLSEQIELPTVLPEGHVFAPCPHDQGCPRISLQGPSKPCVFSTKWRDFRADGKTSKRKDGTAGGRFSYVILEKGERPKGCSAQARILDKVKGNKHTVLTACTEFDGIQRFTVSKRAGPIYAAAKTIQQGDLSPVNMKTVDRDSDYELFDDLTSSH